MLWILVASLLEAERRFPGIGVREVPIRLVFDEKERFGSMPSRCQ